MTISAKIIADSVANGIRITTMELEYPRFIHAECKTHRILSLDDENYEVVLKQSADFMEDPMLSRNASSSRAIPVKKFIERIQENPAMPIHWGKNQPGMQADEELDSWGGMGHWQGAIDCIVDIAFDMANDGYHKQVVNRLLDTFAHIKVIVTATEWDNFFKLRLHPSAQPEMQELARCMKEAMDNSVPVKLMYGEWHLPYVEYDEFECADGSIDMEKAIKCSVARCARVSYLNHDKSNPDIEMDIALANTLLLDGHMSPFEHQATPMLEPIDTGIFISNIDIYNMQEGVTHVTTKGELWSGNFRGWIQYRQTL